jgi:hypothetical protein
VFENVDKNRLGRYCAYAMPVVCPLVGGAFAYYAPLHTTTNVVGDVLVGAGLGLLGGLSVYGVMHSLCCHTHDNPSEPKRRGYINKDGVFIETQVTFFYNKADAQDNEKSVERTSVKLEQKKKKQAEETKEILEKGTEGIRRDKLGLDQKSDVEKNDAEQES